MFKTLLLAGASVAAFATTAADAATFFYSGSAVQYTIPTTGLYDLSALGGSGGNAFYGPGGSSGSAAGRFNFNAGSVLDIYVGGGGGGGFFGGGGGGGTFVLLGSTVEMVAGGGGGGAATFFGGLHYGGNAGTGGAGSGNGGAGGSYAYTAPASGGGAGVNGGGGGPAGGATPANGAGGGGGYGGAVGGFGGGGGGGAGGGGGGGYTGGNGGGLYAGGGGGTSFVNAAATNASIGVAPGAGDGTFEIDAVNPVVAAVPEPATWAMMILGLGGVGAAMRRARARRLERPRLA